MEEETFFVGIPDHVEVRKELLTSSKNLLDSLKRHETYVRIKNDKLRAMVDLKRVFDELLLLNKKLRGRLPKVPVKIPAEAPVETPELKEFRPHIERAAKSKLDVLEEELAKVEQRLSSLE